MKRASLVLLFLAGIVASRGLTAAPIPVSTAPAGLSMSGNNDSSAPILSSDGNVCVFSSRSSNLATNSSTGVVLDVFVRNLTNGITTLVSATPDGLSGGNGHSTGSGISSNNQWVVFESRASNLVTNDNNQAMDIFLRDLTSGSTRLVSVNLSGTGGGNGDSSNPAMTPDGRFIAFESKASNLAAHDTNGVSDVFVRDMENGITTLVSVNSNGVFSANAESTSPVISADGRIVAFISLATNLSRGTNLVVNSLYVRDLVAGSTKMADVPTITSGPSVTVTASSHVLSEDGQFLCFRASSSNTNRVRNGIYYCDLVAGTVVSVTTNMYASSVVGHPGLQGPVMNADGRFVAFSAPASPMEAVYLWSSQGGVTELISTNTVFSGGFLWPFGISPAISADGSKIAYRSYSTNDPPVPNNSKLQLFVHNRASGVTKQVTVENDGSPGSDAEFPAVSFSGDGRLVAFQSRDDNLIADDGNLRCDVFAREFATDITTLISQRADALPSLTALGASSILPHCQSADGRLLVFVSDASNLVTNDHNGVADVFVRDLLTGSNILVSVDAAGAGSGNGFSRDPVISANGRYVAFVSFASNLVDYDTNGLDDVFLRDLQAGTTRLISISLDQTNSANGASSKPSLSSDGRWVTFLSTASDIVTNDTTIQPDVFVFDSVTGSNQLISVNSSGAAGGNGPSDSPLITADGRRIVFQTKATDLLSVPILTSAYQFYTRDLVLNQTTPVSRGSSVVTGNAAVPGGTAVSSDGNWVAFVTGTGSPLYLGDLRTDANTPNTLVATNAAAPSLSADGRWLAYERLDSATAQRQIWVSDRQSGSNVLVSINGTGTGGGNGASTQPVVSDSGRFVVFKSQADDLVGNDTNAWSDIFARDLVRNTTYLISLNQTGVGGGNRLSSIPVLGDDGRTVLFQSFASDLAGGDGNNNRDLFLVRLGAGDSDDDGMPDDWEVAHFGDLSHDGSSDTDGDGVSDLAEYMAGTDPRDGNPDHSNSVLRVLSITPLQAGATTLVWSAVPGKDYRVQFKDDLASPWIDLATSVTVSGTQGSTSDPTASLASDRFYRVVVLP